MLYTSGSFLFLSPREPIFWHTTAASTGEDIEDRGKRRNERRTKFSEDISEDWIEGIGKEVRLGAG